NIASNTNWTVTISETWLILSSNNGTGDATITVTVQNNPTANSRNSVVTVRATGVSDITVTVTQAGSPTGIDETENDRIKIYPNPAKDHLIISTENYSDMPDYSIRIVSLPGTIVFETKVTETFYQLNLSELPGKGIYILQVYDNKSATKTLRKIIIQ
ncbi:MAG: putative binding domain, N-terminal, partial [Bacteroidetes bacterium]|nr:putative binding domain, N-terminal [Bacteroidota bacterium]